MPIGSIKGGTYSKKCITMERKSLLLIPFLILLLVSLFFNFKPTTTSSAFYCGSNHTFTYCLNEYLFMFNPSFMRLEEMCEIKKLLEGAGHPSNSRVNTTHFSALYYFGDYTNCLIQDYNGLPRYYINCKNMYEFSKQWCHVAINRTNWLA